MGKNKTPDAWEDDDWEAQADRAENEPEPEPPTPAPTTRAKRLAKHAEEQRKLWESAEAPPQSNFLLAATDNVPLTTPFKPAVKLLSRKPAPKTIVKRDPITGMEQLTLVDDDAEQEEDKKPQETPEEIRMRQQRMREEKQRRYEEARAKIFGDSNPSSGQSTPGNVTPPHGGDNRQNHRGRGGRGRGRGRGGYHSQPAGTRELFDPSYSPKPGFSLQKRSGDSLPQSASRSTTPRVEDQAIRAPRGPDSNGRGGFARRGGKDV
ncbi:hypothetical protein QBC34DRAFT_96899 [Podospora aff. communis PSN243]|uniref:SUZ domain-containing protein n=1 Tax=Podospora aff. communis PSN243 TaxID=3040156 RepID=A0AAV9GNK7_9PEZI|nr:hypothetical protein QBC34DRAFT_96899 [Podospora aff. communis PSN243]